MQETGVRHRRLRKIAILKRESNDGEQVMAVQRAIASLLSGHPKEMLSASNAFLCGWLARDNQERKPA